MTDLFYGLSIPKQVTIIQNSQMYRTLTINSDHYLFGVIFIILIRKLLSISINNKHIHYFQLKTNTYTILLNIIFLILTGEIYFVMMIAPTKCHSIFYHTSEGNLELSVQLQRYLLEAICN